MEEKIQREGATEQTCSKTGTELDISAWYSIEMPEEGREIMANSAIIPFGTGLWS